MSMDLIVWKEPVVSEPAEVNALIDPFHDDADADAFQPSTDVLRFYDELLERYPALESFGEAELEKASSTFWSVTPERSDRVVIMNLQWRVPDHVLNGIVGLAKKHELMLYDPQGPDIHEPGESEVEAIRRDPRVLRQALVGLLIGVAFVAGGILAPIPVLDWIAIGIGSFLMLMATYAVVVWLKE